MLVLVHIDQRIVEQPGWAKRGQRFKTLLDAHPRIVVRDVIVAQRERIGLLKFAVCFAHGGWLPLPRNGQRHKAEHPADTQHDHQRKGQQHCPEQARFHSSIQESEFRRQKKCSV